MSANFKLLPEAVSLARLQSRQDVLEHVAGMFETAYDIDAAAALEGIEERERLGSTGFGGGGFGGGRGAGGGAAAPGTTAPAGAAGAAGTRPAPVMNEIEREQMMLQMQRAISSTISGQLSSVVSSLEGFTLPVTAETKADIKELSGKLKALAADVKNIGAEVRKIVPAPVKKD